jgi:uncharacterized membrane protein YgdD (TMEM256/DUF423 family)
MTGIAWLRVGAVLGFLAVAIGAFGAHGLKEHLDRIGRSATFETAVQYHFYHALALLAVGLLVGPHRAETAGQIAGWSFLVGVLMFSGSLYVLSLTGNTKLGMITPFGGLAFLAGWLALAVAASGAGVSPESNSASSAIVKDSAKP